jgi:hypothetical protein
VTPFSTGDSKLNLVSGTLSAKLFGMCNIDVHLDLDVYLDVYLISPLLNVCIYLLSDGEATRAVDTSTSTANQSYHSQSQLRTNELSVQVRGVSWQAIQQTFTIIIDLIRDLCSSWAGLEWKRFTFAPSYLQERFSIPIMIAIEEMEEQLIKGGGNEFMTPEGIREECSWRHTLTDLGDVVDIATVAPDIALSLYQGKRISYQELEIQVPGR